MEKPLLQRRRGRHDSTTASEASNAPASLPPEAPDQPRHHAQDSLFSSASGYTNYWGFFNLAMLLLFVSNGRVALENFIKYGILVNPLSWINAIFSTKNYSIWVWPNLSMVALSNITVILVLLTEKALARRLLSNFLAFPWYLILISAHVTLPVLITLQLKSNPFFACNALSVFVIQTLKLTSYIHVNYWCRSARDAGYKPKNGFLYPGNLTFGNMYYFIFAPTLCYQLKFPRTPSRRKSFIVKRLLELCGFSFLIVAFSQQWVMPLVNNSMSTFSEMSGFHRAERVLKLAVPNLLIWLLGFYTVFHSFFNLTAEILRFADREFYRDFWNAETITYFWQTWNIPVHRWCVRHVYKPLVRNGHNRFIASLLVFLISAVFHEYVVSVPLQMFRLWAFMAMLNQIPLSYLTDRVIRGGRTGNIVVWLSIILGQPMAILMYVHDWYLINYPDHCQKTNVTATPPF